MASTSYPKYIACAPRPPQPFRFMDLPAELRCMVYRLMQPATSRLIMTKEDSKLPDSIWPSGPIKMSDSWRNGPTKNVPSSITVLRKTLPVALLRTCRLINAEAKPIFQLMLDEIAKEPLRLLMDYSSVLALTTAGSPLQAGFGIVTYTSDHKIRPPPNAVVGAFTARVWSSVRRKEKRRIPGLVDVEITMTQNREFVSQDKVNQAFSGIQRLAKDGPPFDRRDVRFEVVVEESLLRYWAHIGRVPPVRVRLLYWSQFRQHMEMLKRLQVESVSSLTPWLPSFRFRLVTS